MTAETLNSVTSVLISFVALIVSVIALVYTAKTYLLKAGADIRGMWSTRSSVQCEDVYVSNVVLENLKDRAVVIFKIYLLVGQNYYLEIEDFENSPLTLGPFEAYKKEYEPLDYYSAGTDRVLLNDLLQDRSVKKRLVLSTSEGRYQVREAIRYWDPIFDYFRNYMTEVIHPMRTTYEGKSYGSNAKFIVEFKMPNGKSELVPIYTRDYEYRTFRNFDLTKEALASKEALENHLYQQVVDGKLSCEDVVVYDLDGWRREFYRGDDKKTWTATNESWFRYHILGRISAVIINFRAHRQNRSSGSKKGKRV